MPVSRIDGVAKVTGRARYAAEHPAEDLCFGVVVNTGAPKGRITAIHTESARAVPGVIEIITHENRPKMRAFDFMYKDMTAPAGSPFRRSTTTRSSTADSPWHSCSPTISRPRVTRPRACAWRSSMRRTRPTS